MFSRPEQHTYVRIELATERRVCEIRAAPKEAVDRSTVTQWKQKLRDGDLNIGKLLEDRQLICDEKAAEVRISRGRAFLREFHDSSLKDKACFRMKKKLVL